MGRQPSSDFLVDTNGHCFICLSNPSSALNSGGLGLGPATPYYASAHALSRYLKMDMSKVFHEKATIPSDLLDTVRRSKLKVALCEQCAKWNSKVAGLCRQLEKIETEVAFYLELVQGSLSRSNQDIKTDLFYKMRNNDDDATSNGGLLEKIRIVKALRTEAMERCSHKLKTSSNQPRIKVQKLTGNQVFLRKQRIKSRKNNTSLGKAEPDVGHNMSNDEISFSDDGDHIKTEDSDTDRNDHFGVDIDPEYMDYSNGNEEDELNNTVAWKENHSFSSFADDNPLTRQTTSTSVKIENTKWETVSVATSSEKVLPSTSSTKEVQKLTFAINPETGKFKCDICSAELTQKWHLREHYESVHLKIKHKCNLCGKEFSKKSNYTAHHRTAHVGVRFKCNLCDKCYASKQYLILHQQSAHLGTKKLCFFVH